MFRPQPWAPPVYAPRRLWVPSAPAAAGGRVPPTLVAYSESDWGTDTDKTTADTFTWQTGDVFAVLGMTEGDTVTLTLPTTGGSGLSFSAMPGTPTATSGWCKGYGWSATATGAGSGTISSTAGTAFAGIAVWQWRGSDGVGAPAVAGGTPKTVSLTRTADESAVCEIIGDFSGAVVTGYSYTPAGAEDREATSFTAAHYTVYVADWLDQDLAGTTSYGITGTASTGNHTKVAVEVQGSAGGAPAASTAPWTHLISPYGGFY